MSNFCSNEDNINTGTSIPGLCYVMDADTKADFFRALTELEKGFIHIMQQNADIYDINSLIKLVLRVIRQIIEHDELSNDNYDTYFKQLVIKAIMEKVGYYGDSHYSTISFLYRVFLHLCLSIEEEDFNYTESSIGDILEIEILDRMVIIELEKKVGPKRIFDDDYDMRI